MAKINKGKIIEAANKALQKGNRRKAIKEFEKILKADPDDIRITLKVADLYALEGDKDRARELFEKVGEYYKNQGFLLKALAVYKQIENKIAGKDPEIYLELAELYEQLGLLNDAITNYKRAAKLYKEADNKKQWLSTIEKMLELDPTNVKARLRLAELFSEAGMIKEAVYHYKKVASVLKSAGANKDFIKVAQRLLYHQQDDFETNKDLAEIYLEQGDALNALIRLRVCYQLKPHDTEVLDLIARTFEFLKQPHKAVPVLKELARIYEKNGLLQERDEVYKRILNIDPSDTSAKRVLRIAAVGVSKEEELSFDNTEPEALEEFEAEEIPLDDEEEIPIGESSGEPERTLVQNMDAIIQQLVKESEETGSGLVDISLVPQHLQGDIKELEFYIDAEMWEEARILLNEIKEKAPDLDVLEKFEKLIEENSI